MIVVYHNADLDGICSAVIAHMYFTEDYPVDHVRMVGMDYGDWFPWEMVEEDEDLLFLDFCLEPFSQMEKLAGECGRLKIIDHHPSTRKGMNESQGGGIKLFYSEGFSACELTWGTFYQQLDVPESVQLIGAYDRWDKSDEDLWHGRILPFQYGLRTRIDRGQEFTPAPLWDDLLFGRSREDLVDDIVDIGKGVLSYRRRTNEEVATTQHYMTELDGHQAVAINGTCADNSMLFEAAPDADVMINYYWIGPHNSWTVELFSAGDVDVSEIAGRYGGGGHEGAAGFQCDELPFPVVTCQPTLSGEIR